MELENYFFQFKKDNKKKKVFILIIYDIVDNKKRTKFAKYLEGYGERVQKSAFEACISQNKYEKLLRQIPRFVAEMDSVRVYRMSGKEQITSWGKDAGTEDEDIVVI